MTFTDDQQKVIDLRKQNILVSAAAGSGKTAVLVERILGLIMEPQEPVDVDRLLVVTFTKAAATEMRERIGKAIAERLSKDPENVHLQRQSALIHNAQVTTIDSFCTFLLRNHFQEAGIDPGFRVGDEGELQLIRRDVLADLLEEEYASGDPAFLELTDAFGTGRSDSAIEGWILDLYDFSMSYPWPEDWLSERMKDYAYETAEDLSDSSLVKDILGLIKRKVKDLFKLIDIGIDISGQEPSLEPYIETFEMDREVLESLLPILDHGRPFDEIRGLFNAASFDRLKSTKGADETLKKQAQKLHGAVKDGIEVIKKSFFYDTAENLVKAMKVARRTVNKLVQLTIDFAADFKEAKKDRGVIDFSDMEHMAVEILVKKNEDGTYGYTDVADMYRDHFAEVMCDEYQDSNLVQEIILRSISRPEGQKGVCCCPKKCFGCCYTRKAREPCCFRCHIENSYE